MPLQDPAIIPVVKEVLSQCLVGVVVARSTCNGKVTRSTRVLGIAFFFPFAFAQATKVQGNEYIVTTSKILPDILQISLGLALCSQCIIHNVFIPQPRGLVHRLGFPNPSSFEIFGNQESHI